jgi:hypothetical protein
VEVTRRSATLPLRPFPLSPESKSQPSVRVPETSFPKPPILEGRRNRDGCTYRVAGSSLKDEGAACLLQQFWGIGILVPLSSPYRIT